MAKRVTGDTAAERAVLAGVCRFGRDALVDIEDIVNIDSFTKESNQILFKCVTTALESSDSVDVPSIMAAATHLHFYDMINQRDELEFIKSLFIFPIKKENVRVLAKKIRKIQLARELQIKIEEIHGELSNVTGTESVDEILALAETGIFDYTNELSKNSTEGPTLLFANAEEYLQHQIDNRVDMAGLKTPFKIYDQIIGGGQRAGSVNLIVARPKVGKTTFAMTVAMAVALDNIPVIILDTEMSKHDQINRSVAAGTKVLTNSIETGKFGDNEGYKERVFNFVKKHKSSPLWYQNIAGKPFEEVLSILRRWVVRNVGVDENGNTKPCLVIYDYFKLMDENTLHEMKEYQAIGFQLTKFTDFANQYKVSALAFAQANRDGIEKESTAIISQSDRLLWFCGSCCFLRRKTQEEIVNEGLENGTHKMIPLECRYGAGLDGDWINFHMDGNYSTLRELTTYKQALVGNNPNLNGFGIEDADDEDDEVPFD